MRCSGPTAIPSEIHLTSKSLRIGRARPRCFFLLWPLFARASCHWFVEFFMLSSPGVQSVFFVAPRWAPRPFGGAKAKKITPPRVFFCSGHGERQGKEKPRWGPGFFFFFLWPLFARAPRWCFFFLLWPRAGAQRGFSFPCLSPGPEQEKKNTQGGVYFCSGPAEKSRRPTGRNNKNNFAHPGTTAKKNLETNDTGHEQKGATTKTKKTTHSLRPWTAMLTHFFSGATFPAGPGWCFFFAAAPRGRSLTHCGLHGAISARPGSRVVFVFFAAAPPNPASQ